MARPQLGDDLEHQVPQPRRHPGEDEEGQPGDRLMGEHVRSPILSAAINRSDGDGGGDRAEGDVQARGRGLGLTEAAARGGAGAGDEAGGEDGEGEVYDTASRAAVRRLPKAMATAATTISDTPTSRPISSEDGSPADRLAVAVAVGQASFLDAGMNPEQGRPGRRPDRRGQTWSEHTEGVRRRDRPARPASARPPGLVAGLAPVSCPRPPVGRARVRSRPRGAPAWTSRTSSSSTVAVRGIPTHRARPRHPAYPVARAAGVRLTLTDGRSLIDGMASWWSAIHGYHAPGARPGGHRPARADGPRHVRRPDPRAGRGPGPTAHRHDARTPDAGVLSRTRDRCRSRSPTAMAVQHWSRSGPAGQDPAADRPAGGYHGDTFGAMAVCDPVNGMHQIFRGVLADQLLRPGAVAGVRRAVRRLAPGADARPAGRARG